MTTNHIKAILTSLRAMVVKMLPAYKFYLGSTTETVTTQICHGVMSVEDGEPYGNGALTIDDASFAGFVEGETYTVAVNGVSGEYVAVQQYAGVVITNIQDFENLPENGWSIGFISTGSGEPNILMYTVLGSYANATISVSQTKTATTKKYKTKKLDNSLLPDSVGSGIEEATTKAATALSAAQAAQDTANEAISSANTAQTMADTAQSTANTAKSTADTAKSTADTAQSTANTAKSTADTALARSVEPYTGITQMAPLYKNGGFSAWRSVVQYLLYDKTEGYFSSDGRSTTALNGEEMPDGVFCVNVYVGNKSAKAFLTKGVNTAGSGSWSVRGFAVIDEGYSRTGEILYVRSNTIPQYAAKGLFLTFRAPDSMLLKSSTSGSDKQFRITVDDAGTLKATEVTDA